MTPREREAFDALAYAAIEALSDLRFIVRAVPGGTNLQSSTLALEHALRLAKQIEEDAK